MVGPLETAVFTHVFLDRVHVAHIFFIKGPKVIYNFYFSSNFDVFFFEWIYIDILPLSTAFFLMQSYLNVLKLILNIRSYVKDEYNSFLLKSGLH